MYLLCDIHYNIRQSNDVVHLGFYNQQGYLYNHFGLKMFIKYKEFILFHCHSYSLQSTWSLQSQHPSISPPRPI